MLGKWSALREACPLRKTVHRADEKGSPAGSLFLNCQRNRTELKTERDPRSQKHRVEGLVTALRPYYRSSYAKAGAVALTPPDSVRAAVTTNWDLCFSDLGSRSVQFHPDIGSRSDEIPPVYPTDGSC